MYAPDNASPTAHRLVRTVLGGIDSETAGVVDIHGDVFFSTPLPAGEALDDAETRACDFVGLGGETIVQ